MTGQGVLFEPKLSVPDFVSLFWVLSPSCEDKQIFSNTARLNLKQKAYRFKLGFLQRYDYFQRMFCSKCLLTYQGFSYYTCMTYHWLQDSLPVEWLFATSFCLGDCSKNKSIIFFISLEPLQVSSTMAPQGNSHVSTSRRSMWSVQIPLDVAQDLPPSAGTSRCAVS